MKSSGHRGRLSGARRPRPSHRATNSRIATAGIAVGGALAARALDRPGQDQ
jgi:hypothetical protein